MSTLRTLRFFSRRVSSLKQTTISSLLLSRRASCTRNVSSSTGATTDFTAFNKQHDEGRPETEAPHDDSETEQGALYPNHIPTSCFQKAVLTAGSAALSLVSPWRDDMIAVMGEVTGKEAIKYMMREMRKDPVGQQILEEQPRINSRTVDLDYLSTLPEGTFGKEYSNFIHSQRITPDARRPVQFVDDPDLAYVMQRYREVHDLVHVLLGMPTHMLGEVCVKWVEGLQLRLPLGLLGGLFGALRLRPKQRALYRQEHMWWALRVGRDAHFLMNIYYEHHWERDIHDMRQEFNIEEPPASTPSKRW